MVATNTEWIRPLKPDKDYIFLLEHLEPAMEKSQLNRVIEKHNAGMDYNLIAKQEKRNPAEIIVALIHQMTATDKYNKASVDITRPFAWRG